MKIKRKKTITSKPEKAEGLYMVIDGSNLAYRAYHKFTNIRSRDQGPVGLIYGFIKILQSYLVRFNPTKVVVIFDTKQSKASNFRVKLFPDYKAQRGKTNITFDYELFNKQILVTMKILKWLGIPVIADKEGLGFECDDYIAHIVTHHKGKSLIISSDKDFCQLLNKDVKQFNPFKDTLIRYDTCESIVGYKPHLHKELLMLTGDSSDNIPGYKGIGPVTAKAFFNQFGSIQNFLDDPEASFPKVTREGIEFIYKRNRPLIDLVYALTINSMDIIPVIDGKYNPEKLTSILNKYSMATMVKPDFIEPFKRLIQ